MAEAVAAMQQLAEEGILFLRPFPQPLEQLGFSDGEGDGCGDERKVDGYLHVLLRKAANSRLCSGQQGAA